MTSNSTVTVSAAQANLPKLIRQDSFAIARHGKGVGVFLSKDRMEALVESMELLADPEFSKALKEHGENMSLNVHVGLGHGGL